MSHTTRRHFLASASAAAGVLTFADHLGMSQSAAPVADGLKLRYIEPAQRWVDALPLGNGRLGAMVFGGGAVTPVNFAGLPQ